MNKITILLLALVASSAFAQTESCSANFLATAFDFTLLSDSIAGTAFDYCQTLQDGWSCCSAATVNAFQEKADGIVADLGALTGVRDVDMLFLRNEALANNAAFTRLEGLLGGELSDEVATAIEDLTSTLGTTGTDFSDFVENLQDLIDDFESYQSKRKTCLDYMINLQASTWCLSCNPPTAFDAVVTEENTLTFSTDKKEAAAAACAPYFIAAAAHSVPMSLYYSSTFFATFADAVEGLINGDANAADDLATALESFGTITAVREGLLPVTLPPSCTATSCNWIFTNAFINGELQYNALARGGVLVGSVEDDEDDEEDDEEETTDEEEETTDDEEEDDEEEETTDDEEEEEEEEEEAARRLQADDGWNPADDEAGVTVDFPENPGNVDPSDTSNSAFRTGVIASIIALFALLI